MRHPAHVAAERRPARPRRSGRACGTFSSSQLPITGRWKRQPAACEIFDHAHLSELKNRHKAFSLLASAGGTEALRKDKERSLPVNKAADALAVGVLREIYRACVLLFLQHITYRHHKFSTTRSRNT